MAKLGSSEFFKSTGYFVVEPQLDANRGDKRELNALSEFAPAKLCRALTVPVRNLKVLPSSAGEQQLVRTYATNIAARYLVSTN